MILKDSRLSASSYPAIGGLPKGVGIPEWHVLSDSRAPLDHFLPEVFAARELKPQVHYQYLMSDLARDHVPAMTTSDVGLLAVQLRELQAALASWAELTDYLPTVHHDLDAAPQFLAFAHQSFDSFLGKYPDSPVVKSVLEEWPAIVDAYVSVNEVDTIPHVLNHGDYHRRNIYVSTREPVHVRLIDWEWMGVGPPHIDLASMAKRRNPAIQRHVVSQYFDDDVDPATHWRIFLWALLNRTLLDATLHAAQNASPLGRTPNAVSAHLEVTQRVVTSLSAT